RCLPGNLSRPRLQGLKRAVGRAGVQLALRSGPPDGPQGQDDGSTAAVARGYGASPRTTRAANRSRPAREAIGDRPRAGSSPGENSRPAAVVLPGGAGPRQGGRAARVARLRGEKSARTGARAVAGAPC